MTSHLSSLPAFQITYARMYLFIRTPYCSRVYKRPIRVRFLGYKCFIPYMCIYLRICEGSGMFNCRLYQNGINIYNYYDKLMRPHTEVIPKMQNITKCNEFITTENCSSISGLKLITSFQINVVVLIFIYVYHEYIALHIINISV